MRQELLDHLRCPRCRGPLQSSAPAPVVDGELSCAPCALTFPVRDGVAALVAPESPLFASVKREEALRPNRASVGTNADRQRDYWETDTWYRDVHHPVVEGFSRQRWEHLARRVPLSSISTALDVGAGNGFSTIYAPPHLKLTATDGSWRMLSRHPGQDRVLSDATALPFPDRSFDLVFCWELLHHVPEPWRAIQEMGRVSSKYVLFFEPNPWNAAQAGFAVADPEHRWVLRFTKSYTVDQVKKAGLKLVSYERCGLIFPNKTPEPLFGLLKRLPFQVPFVGISQLVVAERA